MASYKLARAAEQDFENIFGFGIDTFGLDQALSYQNGMRQRFEKLVEQPKIYPAVDHIRAGYRRSGVVTSAAQPRTTALRDRIYEFPASSV